MQQAKRKQEFIKIKDPIVKKTYPFKDLGTTHEWIQVVECPNCHHEYARKISEGCFHSDKDPSSCPKCNYPWNVIHEAVEKARINPSKRDSK